MLYIIDSLNTVIGYDTATFRIESIDKDIAVGAMIYEDFQSYIHVRSVDRLKKLVRIIDLVNQDPLITVPNIKENDQIIYYDYTNDNFYWIEVLSPSKV